jgi:hypothetical protein
MQPEPAGVDTGQIGLVLRGANGVQDIPDLGKAEHNRQALFAFGMNQIQGMPLALEHIDEKKLDTAVADP